MASSFTNITLSSLLPTPYVLIYTIPLLIASVLVTFAGTFLTLDRTRTFAPQSDASSIPGDYDAEDKQKPKGWWRLEGGLGGLLIGWISGVYLATFLALLIMNRTHDAPLQPVHFLVIHLISSTVFTFVCGRFKYAALACDGIAGGMAFALLIAVALHPSLLTRLVFVAIIIPVTLIGSLLPIVKTQHWFLRVSSASLGSVSIVLSIALLAHISAWADVWDRLWLSVSPTNDWGTGAERGLSAVAFALLALGIASDWGLKRQFGEDPDQKWDEYLSKYAANLPTAGDRAGTFKPLQSFWERLITPSHPADIKYPQDEQAKLVPLGIPGDFDGRSTPFKTGAKRSAVKFQPLEGYSSDEDSGDEFRSARPRLTEAAKEFRSSTTLSGVTLYGEESGAEHQDKKGELRPPPPLSEAPVYSDSDGEDITTPGSTPLKRTKSHRDEPGWKPDFIKRHMSRSDISAEEVPLPPRGAVPMTPSLIKAIDRISVAQQDVRESPPPPLTSSPSPHVSSEHWQSFWHRVREKAAE